MSEPDFPPPREFNGDRLMGFRASWLEQQRVRVGSSFLGLPAYDFRPVYRQGWFLSGYAGPGGTDTIMVLPDGSSKVVTLYAHDVSLRPIFQTRNP